MSTLSVRTLIIIPVITLALFLIVLYVIEFWPPLGKELDGESKDKPKDVENGLGDNSQEGSNGVQDR